MRKFSYGLFAAVTVMLAWTTYSSAAVVTIVESRSGGLNFTAYSESGVFPNAWANSSSKSSAPGLTAGIGSRFNSTSGVGGSATWFQVSPILPQAGGVYTVDITHLNFTGTVTSNIVQTGGTGLPASTGAFTGPGGANTWENVGTITLNSGVNQPAVRFEETALTGSTARFYADGVRFSLVAPNKVTSPNPADGATGVGTVNGSVVDALLSWTAGTINNFKYDVFLGTTSGSLVQVADDITSTNFLATGLNGNTQYFWRVDAFNVENVSAGGDEYDFTTVAVPEPAAASLILLAGTIAAARRRR